MQWKSDDLTGKITFAHGLGVGIITYFQKKEKHLRQREQNVQSMNVNGLFEDWNVTYQWGNTELIGDSQHENLEGHAKGFLQWDI